MSCFPSGQALRLKGHNRIGNMIVPNDNYCRFEEWFQPIMDEMLVEQVEKVQAITVFATRILCCGRLTRGAVARVKFGPPLL